MQYTLCLKKNCTPKAGRHKFCYFPNTKKIRNTHFVGIFILNKSCEFYYDDVTMTSFIGNKFRRRCCQMRSVMNSMRLFVAWLPWKPCSWYSTRTKLFELNRSATERQCLVWKIIMGELILMNLCRSALWVQVFLRHSVYIYWKLSEDDNEFHCSQHQLLLTTQN